MSSMMSAPCPSAAQWPSAELLQLEAMFMHCCPSPGHLFHPQDREKDLGLLLDSQIEKTGEELKRKNHS